MDQQRNLGTTDRYGRREPPKQTRNQVDLMFIHDNVQVSCD